MNLAQRMAFNKIGSYHQVSRKGSFSLDAQTEKYNFKKTWEEIFERFSLTTDKRNANEFIIYFACLEIKSASTIFMGLQITCK